MYHECVNSHASDSGVMVFGAWTQRWSMHPVPSPQGVSAITGDALNLSAGVPSHGYMAAVVSAWAHPLKGTDYACSSSFWLQRDLDR
jgi:hypothetical protein